MTRQRWLFISVLLLLLISVGLNAVLYRFGANQYRQARKIRLDPTSERHFAAENAALSSPASGVSRVVFFGDSRIADWENLPDVPGAEILNRGIGGETTAQMLLRLDRDVIALEPDVVVLQAGVNDLAFLGLFPHRATAIIETCRLNLERMITRMREAGIRVVVMTILPAGSVPLQRRPVWSEQTRDAIEQINSRLRSTDYFGSPAGGAFGSPAGGAFGSPAGSGSPAGKGTGGVVVDCDSVSSDGRRTKPEYELNTLHLNALGYEALNALVEPVLTRLVQGSGRPG